MTSLRTRIALHLEIEGDQISGCADDGSGAPQSFLGWLGLIAAIDQLLERAQATSSPVADMGREADLT